jgi:bacterioferritin-associated ferredoxin
MHHDTAPDACQSCPIKVVCRCLQVTEDEVVAAITTHDLHNIKQVRRHTGAGDGCTCCHDRLRKLIDQHAAAPAAACA